MANENVPAPAPIRSGDQILPFGAWLDEDWFTLDADLLREALEITPIDQDHQFESPPLGNAIIDFVNELGYPEELHFVSRMVMNNLYQPWRVILSMINQCLISKTYGYERPRYPTFLADKANLGVATKKEKKIKPHVIPYYQRICYLGRKHNINQRSESSFNMEEDDHQLGNFKFVSKGEEDEVFGMPIPKELITDNIRNAPYYNTCMEMVAKHDHKIDVEEGGKKKSAAKSDQSKKPATAKQPKPVSSKQSKPAPAKQLKPKKEKSTPKLPIVEGKGKGIAIDEHVAQLLLELQTPKKTKIGAENDKMNSERDIEILNIGEEQGKDVATKRILMEEDQAGPNLGQSHVALAGPEPEPMHFDFIATMYPQVRESLKQPDEECVYVENPLSSTGTLSTMKNLDAYTFGDQFLMTNKQKRFRKNKHGTNETTTTLSPPPLQQQSIIDHALASCVLALETVCANFEKRHKIQDKIVQVRERFRDLSKADMKEILYDWMFESGSKRSQPEHVALYKALKASMDRDNMDEFLEATAKSHKRHRDDQDPPPPPPNSDQGKKKRHNSNAYASHQPQALMPSAWKTTDSRDIGKSKLSKADLEGPAYKVVRAFHSNNISL
nr:E-beta-farnesene synthase [Tanacetum cinerariifolium]